MARILVMDDDGMVRDMLEEMLQTSNHDVIPARDGLEAVEIHRRERCDLVIADIYMPGPDGVETIRNLLELDPGLKILALSGGGGFGNPEGLQRALEAGAAAVMKKPVDMEELLTMVRDLLQARV